MLNRATRWLISISLFSLILTPAGAVERASVDASQARIVDVTVFGDRAEVTREIRLQLGAGPSEILFPRIPWPVEPDSLRASAAGVVASIGSIDLFEQAHEPKKSDAWREADRELKRIERAIQAVRAQNIVHAEMQAFLTSVKATATEKGSEELAAGRMDVAQLRGAYAFVKTGLEDLSKAQLDLSKQEEKLSEERKLALARRRAAGRKGAIRSRTAAVAVEAAAPGALTVRLTYTVPGALWRPSYRTSLDPQHSKVQLDYEAIVTQKTGEDWKDVELVLSTAAPSQGVKPPWLHTRLLQVHDALAYARRQGSIEDESSEHLRVVGREYQSILNLAPGIEDSDGDGNPNVHGARARDVQKQVEEASTASSSLLPAGYNARFQPAGQASIPPDGREHHVLLVSETLDVTLAYRTSPSMAQEAFVFALTKAPADYPLLPGKMRTIVEGSFVGAHVLDLHGPGAELLIPFGIDKSITVKHSRLPREMRKKGVRGKYREIRFAFETTIENHRGNPLTIATEEALPVSEDARVEVTLDEDTTPGWEKIEDRPGIIKWPVTLEPGEKRVVRFAYTVRFPSELAVTGLP